MTHRKTQSGFEVPKPYKRSNHRTIKGNPEGDLKLVLQLKPKALICQIWKNYPTQNLTVMKIKGYFSFCFYLFIKIDFLHSIFSNILLLNRIISLFLSDSLLRRRFSVDWEIIVWKGTIQFTVSTFVRKLPKMYIQFKSFGKVSFGINFLFLIF